MDLLKAMKTFEIMAGSVDELNNFFLQALPIQEDQMILDVVTHHIETLLETPRKLDSLATMPEKYKFPKHTLPYYHDPQTGLMKEK